MMEQTKDVLLGILDAYAYEIVFVDRNHIVQYMNKTAKQRYGQRVQIGQSLFQCHNENSRYKIEEFFVPVRVDGQVIGYFERHEAPWDQEHPEVPVGEYWKRRE